MTALDAHEIGQIDLAIDAAIDSTKKAQSKLVEMRGDSNWSFLDFIWSSRTAEASEIDSFIAEMKSLIDQLGSMSDALMDFKKYAGFLRGFVSELRSPLNLEVVLELSPSGSIIVPVFIEEELQLSSKPWLKRSTPSHTSDALTNITYSYNLQPMNAEQGLEMRPGLSEVCARRMSINITSGYLPMLCTFWDAFRAISPMDDGLSDGAQISWVQEMVARVKQLRRLKNTDQNRIMELAGGVVIDRSKGMPWGEGEFGMRFLICYSNNYGLALTGDQWLRNINADRNMSALVVDETLIKSARKGYACTLKGTFHWHWRDRSMDSQGGEANCPVFLELTLLGAE